MRFRAKLKLFILFLLNLTVMASSSVCGLNAVSEDLTPKNTSIKWMTFNIPYEALSKSMNIDIKSHETGTQINWVDLLSYLGAKYGGNWKKYCTKDMDALVDKLKTGQNIDTLAEKLKHFNYYKEVYNAVLSNFIGDYQIEVPIDNNGGKITQIKYGLKVFSLIAKGYGYSHFDDFGDSRSFGFSRRHLGNDLMGSIGTPIVAVESGVVESLGWNKYGGWRIGIRSFDKKRYYYYAHLRKGHPYAKDLKQGQVVKAGDVIGYLGMTGYSDKEDVNNMKKPHLHFGLQIIFDESQKEGNNQIWIDVYNIVDILSTNRIKVMKDDTTKDYYRVYNFLDLRYKDYYNNSKVKIDR
jgi:murein DD-endopeptidase MepM/ murein hydrolase activator NlpD